MSEQGIDIFSELQKIQIKNISRAGKEQQKILGKMTIQGFLEQKALREMLARKIALSQMGNINSSNNNKQNKQHNINEEMGTFSEEKNIFIEQSNNNNTSNGCSSTHIEDESQRKKEFKQYLKIFQKQHRQLLKAQHCSHITNTKSNIKHKNYSVNYELIEQLKTQRKKSPESCMYNPNYNCICKHIPQVKLQPLKIKVNNNDFLLKENNESNVQSQASFSINESVLSKGRNRSCNVIAFEKYSSRGDIVPKHLRKEKSVLEPYKYKKKVAGPNFKKMLSRNTAVRNTLGKIEGLMDYSPNYDALYSKIKKHFDKKEVERGIKRNMIKKIWSSFDVSLDYIVVPKLNKKH